MNGEIEDCICGSETHKWIIYQDKKVCPKAFLGSDKPQPKDNLLDLMDHLTHDDKIKILERILNTNAYYIIYASKDDHKYHQAFKFNHVQELTYFKSNLDKVISDELY